MATTRRSYQGWLPTVFDDFFDNDWSRRANAMTPAINVLESPTGYEVEVAAPGLTKDDFNIHIDEDNNLVIAMEKKSENHTQNREARYLRREFNYTKFHQTLILPEDVDYEGIEARVADGVLTVVLPKLTPEKKEKAMQHIEVK